MLAIKRSILNMILIIVLFNVICFMCDVPIISKLFLGYNALFVGSLITLIVYYNRIKVKNQDWGYNYGKGEVLTTM